jgi:TolB-like protein
MTARTNNDTAPGTQRYGLRTMGDLRLVDRDDQFIAFPEKGLLVLTYLLAERQQAIGRKALAAILWEDVDIETAMTNLRKTISRVADRQRGLGVSFLEFTATAVRLADHVIDADLLYLRPDVEATRGIAGLQKRLGKLSGIFLENVRLSPKLRIWADTTQRDIVALLSSELASLLHPPVAPRDLPVFRELAGRIFQYDPANEVAQRILAQSSPSSEPIETFRVLFDLQSDNRQAGSGYRSSALAAARRIFEAPVPTPNGDTGHTPLKQARQPLPRLALLPPSLETLGEAAILANSLIEDLTIGLSASRALLVIAPYTSAKIRASANKAALFEDHRIAYVLDTGISTSSAGSALFVQLIQFSDDQIIWAERVSLATDHLGALRRDLAIRLTNTITDQIGRAEKARAYFEQDPQAYYHYLLGQKYLSRLNLPDLRRARKEFKLALSACRTFSPAMSGIARTLTREWLLTARGDGDLLSMAESYASQAIAVGLDLPAGYRELGVTKLFQGEIDESAEALGLAEIMSPHYADVIADLADTLVHASQPGPALEKIKQAMDLNPVSPDSYFWTAAGAAYFSFEFEQAINFVDRMENADAAIRLSAASWAMLGETKRARALVRASRSSHPDFDLDQWLSVVPMKEAWQKEHYKEGLKKAGF